MSVVLVFTVQKAQPTFTATPVPVVEYPCSKCPAKFLSKKDLVKHNIKVKHSDTGVICPWCKDSREYRYPQDLVRHIKGIHLDIINTMPRKTLTTGNLIYFARDPAGYLETHGISPSSTAEEAQFAMNAMERWCEGRTPSFSYYKRCWAQLSNPNPKLRKRKICDIDLLNITIDGGDSRVVFNYNEMPHKARLRETSIKDATIASALLQTLISLPHFKLPPAGLQWIRADEQESLREALACKLNIPASSLQTIFTVSSGKLFKPDNITVSLPPTPTTATVQSISSPSAPSESSLRSPSPISFEEEYDPEFPSLHGGSYQISPEGFPLQYHPIGIDNILETVRHTSSSSSATTSTTSPMCASTLLSTSTSVNNPDSSGSISNVISTTTDSTSAARPMPAATLPSIPSSADRLESSTTVTPPVIISTAETSTPVISNRSSTNASTLPITSSPPPSSSSAAASVYKIDTSICSTVTTVPTVISTTMAPTSSNTCKTPPSSPATPLDQIYRQDPTCQTAPSSTQERAKRLLLSGSLPLLPPGRREWGSVEDECIAITDSMRWPPKGWRNMSPEEKLFVVEWASILLTGKWIGQTKSETIFNYNHLVLPGTVLERDSTTVDMMIANYHVVQRIASSDTPRPDDDAILRAFEGGRPGHLTADLDVALRLQQDS